MNSLQARIVPFLTFGGQAEAAVNFYLSVFPESRVLALTHVTEGDPGIIGEVLNCTFELMGLRLMAMDMDGEQRPSFSWASSLLVECSDEALFDLLFARLSTGGQVLMGPESVLQLRKVAWVIDRFGVTWQLVWE